MRIKLAGNKRDSIVGVVQSGEASANILAGSPIVLAMSGTGDGLSVVNPSTAGQALANALMYGVVTTSLASQQFGETTLMGYVNAGRYTLQTRSATSASWASWASLGSTEILGIDTVNNAFVTVSASLGNGGVQPYAVLLDSLASGASSASATSDTRTAIVTNQRMFIRMI